MHRANVIAIASYLVVASGCMSLSDHDVDRGHVVADLVGYSSASPLHDGEQTVWVVGLAGAVAPVPATIEVTNQRDFTERVALVDDEVGSFAVAVPAARDDILRIRYQQTDLQEDVFIHLGDDLTAVPRPACDACGRRLATEPDADGNATVRLSLLGPDPGDPGSPAGPSFAIVDVDSGFAVLARPADGDPVPADALVPAASGDLVCVYRQRGPVASPSLCTRVP